MLYRIHLANKTPLFLQPSQRFTDKVDAIIPNTPEAKLLAKKMNIQIAAWCHFYWKTTNPGREKFYKKLLDHAFNQVLLHKITECIWYTEAMSITLPNSKLELSAMMEFENQDRVKNIA
jgi:hypothetical protein